MPVRMVLPALPPRADSFALRFRAVTGKPVAWATILVRRNMVKQPNIVFILSDQHRADCLGRVNPVVQTPNLDALASRGVSFPDAVCQGPMCVPSRHSLMTGLYPSQVGVRHNTQCFPKEGRLPVPTLPERLRAAGYRTAGFGKTHWRVGECRGVPFGAEPLGRGGFDVRAVLAAKEREAGCRAYEDEADPEVWEALCREQAAGGPGGQRVPGYLGRTSEVPAEAHGESWLLRQACAFLEEHDTGRQPFFLYFSCDVPHPAFTVPPGYEERYRLEDIELPEQPPEGAELVEHTPFGLMNRAEWSRLGEMERRRGLLRYYAYCSYMDDLAGGLAEALEATGQLENTLIVYTSDHGEMLGERNYRFAKCCLYEGGLRVPLIAAGPGTVAPDEGGRVDDRPAELVDLAPTFLRAAGCGLAGTAGITGPGFVRRAAADRKFRRVARRGLPRARANGALLCLAQRGMETHPDLAGIRMGRVGAIGRGTRRTLQPAGGSGRVAQPLRSAGIARCPGKADPGSSDVSGLPMGEISVGALAVSGFSRPGESGD